ncbi:MAG: CPBP family glutamic-type intramembrane protease [Myxococcota bacterium]|nr:CPBP family glutamic-type intramembrane protease [Myxococcota bacterium]
MTARSGHGWWPYLVPLFSFLLVLQFGGGLPPALRMAVTVAVPAGFFLAYWWQGSYPELRGYPDSAVGFALDFGVGILGGLLWMAPFVALEWAKPDFWLAFPDWLRPAPEDAFDPAELGAGLLWLTLLLRGVGYGLVTPFVEEVFHRSFLVRYAAVFDTPTDFRDVPIGSYDRVGFLVVVLFFTFSHVPWEWPVALLWIVGTQLWFYYRKSVAALVAVHAGSNLGIFFIVWATAGRLSDRAGAPLDLWFFL